MTQFGITFFVPGIPVPKQSGRISGSGMYTPDHVKAWADIVGWEAKQATMESPGFEMLTDDVTLILTFSMPDRKRVDLDNLMKNVSDAMNKIVYDDDSQVVESILRKQIDSKHPGVWVTVIPYRPKGSLTMAHRMHPANPLVFVPVILTEGAIIKIVDGYGEATIGVVKVNDTVTLICESEG